MLSSPDPKKRGVLIRRLLRYREMLPGSLVFTHTRCGKPRCLCAQGEQLHPVCQFIAKVGGKTKTIYIPQDLIPWVQEKFALYKAFQKDVAEIGRINLDILDAKKAQCRERKTHPARRS
jgi:hypothetical protein